MLEEIVLVVVETREMALAVRGAVSGSSDLLLLRPIRRQASSLTVMSMGTLAVEKMS